MADALSEHMTRPRSEDLERQIRQTPDGMAHWAGTGPDGKTCRECVFWMNGGDYYAASNSNGPSLKPAPCRKYKQFMAGKKGNPVPHSARSCKYFEPLDKSLSIRQSTQ